jgi:hypothetical protein
LTSTNARKYGSCVLPPSATVWPTLPPFAKPLRNGRTARGIPRAVHPRSASVTPRLARRPCDGRVGPHLVLVPSQVLSNPTVPGTGALVMLAEAVLTIDALRCRARRWRCGRRGTGHAGTGRVDVMGSLVA